MIYDDQTSSAMNYYEELGVSPQATEQEIRKAHRRLVKLMHPDAQPDPGLKRVAETQMRRLNSIVSTLLDQEQRRAYNDQLQAEMARPKQVGLVSWQGIPWWLASAVGAVILTLVAVWLWADHMGNSYGAKSRRTVYIPPVQAQPADSLPAPSIPGPTESGARDSLGPSYIEPDVKPAAVTRPAKASEPDRLPQRATVSQLPAPVPATVPSRIEPSSHPTVVTVSRPAAKVSPELPLTRVHMSETHPKVDTQPKKVFSMPSGTLIAAAGRQSAQMPLPPGVPAQTGRDYSSASFPNSQLPIPAPPKLAEVTTSASPGSRDPLEGEWVYAPKEPERRRAGFYPPEYINLKLFGSTDPGSLKGQYSAKYVVTDRPVSPEITFQLAAASKGSRKFLWQNADGARGTLSIDPIDERTIRVDWHTTSATHGPALTSGQATLVRR